MFKIRMVAAVIYAIVAITSLILGSLYLFRDQFMPYHATALAMPWEEVDASVQTLILALMKVAAGGWIALGIVILTLIAIPFRQNQPWASYIIPLAILSFYVPNLAATWSVLQNTPAVPPWYGSLIACFAAVIGLLMDAPWFRLGQE